MTDNQTPEDLGAPVAYLVLKDGTPVFDLSGDKIGEVAHVLDDRPTDVFHGLIVKTSQGHRFAGSGQVDGLFEHGVILNVPLDRLPEPSADPAAQAAEHGDLGDSLKRAWAWLIQPK
jgi:hypothetical protein